MSKHEITQRRNDVGRWTIGSGWQELTLEGGRQVLIEHSVHSVLIEPASSKPMPPPLDLKPDIGEPVTCLIDEAAMTDAQRHESA